MGNLTFSWKSVKGLVDSSLVAAPEHRRTVFADLCTPELFKAGATVDDGMVRSGEDLDASKIPLGLVLVGDEGVYLMSGNEQDKTVLYANECNPKTMAFDTWWSAKQAIYGGDDGADRLDMHIFKEVENVIRTSPELAQNPDDVVFCIQLTSSSMRFSVNLRSAKAKPKAAQRGPKTH